MQSAVDSWEWEIVAGQLSQSRVMIPEVNKLITIWGTIGENYIYIDK